MPRMAIGALWSLVSALGVALLLTLAAEPSVGDGIAVGIVCGIAFATASTFTNGIYEQRKPVLSVLFSAYQTVGFAIMGAIIGAMQSQTLANAATSLRCMRGMASVR
ncbi:MAG: DUF1761 domain-containing protein [Actinomycetota bacterium]